MLFFVRMSMTLTFYDDAVYESVSASNVLSSSNDIV